MLALVVSPARAEPAPSINDSPAEAAPISIDKIEIGFQGFYKIGEWTPLWLTLRSSSEQEVTIVVEAPDPDDALASLPSRTFRLESDKVNRCETCFRSGRMNPEIQIRVRDSQGRTSASRRLRTSSDDRSDVRAALRLDIPLWVTVGGLNLDAPSATGDAGAGDRAPSSPDSGDDVRIARFEAFDELPSDWRGWQSVEMLVVTTRRQTDEGRSPLEEISSQTNATVREWVRLGGHLLVSVAKETAAFQESRLASWLPIAVEGQFAVRQLSGFESFAGQYAPLKAPSAVAAARLGKVPLINALIKDAGSGQPLAASVPYGFGRVTIVGVDLDVPPLSNWKALKSVLQKLAHGSPRSTHASTRSANRQLTHVGVTDLATQFQQTQEDFADVHRPSYWSVMGWILIYIAVIGPLDYILVHRVLRRPELTWLSFAILVGAGVAGAAWEANRTNGNGLLVNQFDLVDIDAASGAARAQTWVSLYSPDNRRFSVAVEPLALKTADKPVDADAPADIRLSWIGAPENAVGGMYRSGAGSMTSRSYFFSPAAASVKNFPVAQWSTKSLCGAWHLDAIDEVVDSRLETFGAGQLKGSIVHHLDAPLEDCLLVVGGWAYIPTTADATLMPGAAWRPSGEANVRQRDLKALLTGEKRTRRNKEDTYSTEILTTTEPYNALNRNRGQQLHMISFHEAAGGTGYTGLSHWALRGLELTELMRLGRGILIGRLRTGGSQVLVDGSPARPSSQSTWIRLVFPVSQSDRAPDKIIPKPDDRVRPPSAGKGREL
ncbi:MAG TPA: hypothetical protein VKU82_06285 [Planctomycetaceae bacterium]|nr:hypothetical protein [Planctomycetaceae bacterium]